MPERPASPADRDAHAHPDAWAYPYVWLDAVAVRLAGDRDGDGYHSRLLVSLDVDTDAGFAEVYASVALVDGRGRTAFAHDTGAFGVEGRATWDETSVEFELLDDFAADRYGLYVEVRDARSGEVLDAVGAGEFASLAGLRLEGTRRDGHDHGSGIGYGVGFSSGHASGYGPYGGIRDDGYSSSFAGASYAGPAGPLALAALAVALLARRAPGRRPRARGDRGRTG